jgi:PAS domain S-box-containing protein
LQVLVVEDSRFFASVIRRGIEEKLGFSICLAGDRAQAQALLADRPERFFAALVDLNLPDCTEGEVVDDTVAAGIPTIVFTSAFDDGLRELVLAKNVVDYVTKNSPTSIDQVLSTLRRLAVNSDTRVLVVDDSKTSRRLMAHHLKAHRFQVLEAGDGREALAVMERNPGIRLAFIDYNMAGMDGCALVTEIRRKYSREQMVLIGLSAYGNNLLSARFMKAGASDFINKPFIPEELFCRIYQNLELVDHIAALTREAAERKALERGAAELSSLNEKMIATSALGIAVYRGAGQCVLVNPALAEMVGGTMETLRNQNFRQIASWHDSGLVAAADAALTSGRPEHCAFEFTTSFGRQFWAEVDLSSFLKDGEPHLLAAFRDIGELKRAEEKRHAADAAVRRLSSAVENSSALVIITNRDGRIEYANPRMCQVTGYGLDELIGNSSGMFKSGNTSTETYQSLWRAIIAGEVWQGEFQNKRKDGSLYWVKTCIDPIKDESGAITHFVAVEEDVTESRKTMEALAEAVDAAQSANRAKSEFLSSMSHELRTPLNAVIGFAQMLEYIPNEPLSVPQKKCVDRVLKGGQHLLELIGGILDLSKIEAGHVSLSIENVALDDLLEECRVFVHPLAQRQSIAITVAGPPGVMVVADRTRLKQVLLNLLSNAIKYNRTDGKVVVAYEPAAGNDVVKITVADTGIGISEADRNGLFVPFTRLGQENSNIEGTGIGLTITKRLVEMMGGTIAFTSVVGEGTTFQVEMPLAETVVSALPKLGTVDRAATDGLRGTVLYIEDNPANIELMEMVFLRLGGVRLLLASSGKEGIGLARARRPDLVLLDLHLPDIDGYEVLRLLRKMAETRDIPVFAMTASATRGDIERGREAGFDRYVIKPFLVFELIDAIQDALQKKGQK